MRYVTKFLVSGKRMVVARQKQNFAGDERMVHMNPAVKRRSRRTKQPLAEDFGGIKGT